MEVVGLTLSIIATIDICVNHGHAVIEMCRAFRDADEEIAQRVTLVESSVLRTNSQLKLIKRMDQDLDDSFKVMQVRLCTIFTAKLKDVLARLERLLDRKADEHGKQVTTVKRAKFAFIKQFLDASIDEMERWQSRFDPTWKLVMLRSGGPSVDEALDRREFATSELKATGTLRRLVKEGRSSGVSVHLPAAQLSGMNTHPIPFSTAALYEQEEPKRCYIVDTLEMKPGQMSKVRARAFTKNVRDLSEKLQFVDSSKIGLFRCKGYVSSEEGGYRFIFRQPQHANIGRPPQSLRSMLIAGAEHSLTERINITKQLARAVSYIHSLGFVHKNIRPETIVAFQIDGHRGSHESVFLAGFGQFRAELGSTGLQGDNRWERNLYRHPNRQGENLEDEYIMQHDMYSLGVCLLEIGLWTSFVSYAEAETPHKSELLESLTENTNPLGSTELKNILVVTARKHLPPKMGDRYCDIVVNCLTCLDEDNPDFADLSQFQDEGGIELGVKFMEKIMLQLEDIEI